MRRITGFILLVSMLFIASGFAGYLHQLEHMLTPAGGSNSVTRLLGTPESIHDESNCPVCMTLHAPAISVGVVATLICLGIFIAFLTQLQSVAPVRPELTSVDCRGPPVQSGHFAF